jgi:hypothetical protein
MIVQNSPGVLGGSVREAIELALNKLDIGLMNTAGIGNCAPYAIVIRNSPGMPAWR